MPRINMRIVLLAVVIGFFCSHRASLNRYAPTISSAMAHISDNYVLEVDRRELFEGAMQGMVKNLDEYSGYINPERYMALEEDLNQEFGGVGIEVGVDPDTGRLIVLSPLVNTPASKAGLRAGDLILKIADEDTQGMKLEDSVKLMRGAPGTDVQLLIKPYDKDASRNVTLSRAKIPIRAVLGDTRNADGTWEFLLEEDHRIGYVRLVNFGETTVMELKETLIDVVDRVDALILDIRQNPGGLLTAAVGVCDLFLPAGQAVVSIKGRDGVIKSNQETDSAAIVPADMPIVVLVDRYSASASEIVAACLQDHGRVKVAGQRTWGKGTVQRVLALEGGRSALKLTTATYWRPSGENIHRHKQDPDDGDWGVRPDADLEVIQTDKEMSRRIYARRLRDVIARVRPVIRYQAAKEEPDDIVAETEAQPGNAHDENASQQTEAVNKPTDDPQSDPLEGVAEPDPQLRRAIEHLQRQIGMPKRSAA